GCPEAEPLSQVEAGIDNPVRRATRRERLVRDFSDPPDYPQVVDHTLGIPSSLDQFEIAERSLENVGWPLEPMSRQIAGDNGVPGIEAHLHREQRRTLAVRLHVAAELAVHDGEGVLQPRDIEAHEFA